MKINASIETTLPAGTYWIAYTMTGGASLTGPWTSPVTYYGQPQDHGNALALGASGTWGLMVESANPNAVYELPFVVYGEGVPTYNVYQGAELMASGIKGTTYTATVAVNQGVEIEWCVTASCLAGGESEAGCKTALCTAVDPCNSVTGATAVATCSSATISWTAPAGTGLKYKVVDENGVTLVNDYTQTTYTYTATFENEKNYKWDIYTICTTGVSEKVTVSAVADCTGAIELVNSITIYPNPSSTTVTINTKDFSKVEVYNTVGQLVEINNTGTVEVSSYNTGIYFFKVYTINNQSVIKRVVVSK
jgi:putative ubiquitin-RnfH superfamily antitoxin RatB of RatAB toxin-antitoxin module